MAPERDYDLPPVQPTRRLATVRGLRPRLWTKRVLTQGAASEAADQEEPREAAREPAPAVDAPVTYDGQAHLHGGPKPEPLVDLED